MRLIGDVHGKFDRYERLIVGQPSIQVGDMGVGFRRWPHGEPFANPPHAKMVKHNARFIRGNHDNPAVCKAHSQYIPDGQVEGGVMLIGGAFSIDQAYRTEGYSWWAGEELSIVELNELVDRYTQIKPRVMITHDAPREVGEALASQYISGGPFKKLESRTCQAFQSMWSAHSPDLWVFGHWHHSFDHILSGGRERGTRFVCLAELEYRDDLL